MTDPNAGLEFGFLSSLVNISFPQVGGWLVIEATSTASGPFAESGGGEEAFTVVMPGILETGGQGVTGITGPGPFQLLPANLQQYNPTGPTGATGPPAIVNPISLGMQKVYYDWTEGAPAGPTGPLSPTGYYLANNGQNGAAVAFFNRTTMEKILGNPGSIPIVIKTAAHGSNSKPPLPKTSQVYYVYNTLNGSIAAPGSPTSQTWFDANLAHQIATGVLPPSLLPAVTDPLLDANFAATLTSFIGSDLFYVWQQVPFLKQFTQGFATLAAAQALVTFLNQTTPNEFALFPWWQTVLPPSPYPGQAQCSWTLKASTWRRTELNFPVTAVGTLQADYADAVETSSTSSGGSNPAARTITIAVNPQTARFTMNG